MRRSTLVALALAGGCIDYNVETESEVKDPLDDGPDPCIALVPSAISFDPVEPGVGSPQTEVVVIANTCDGGDLEILGIELQDPGAPFTLGKVGSILVPPGQTTAFTVTFEPSDVGVFSTHATVESNAPQNPIISVGLAGEALGGEESDEDQLSLRPAQTGSYVFLVNPARDTVTRLDAATLTAEVVDVDRDPVTVLATDDTAVVFHLDNHGSHPGVTLLDVDTLEATPVEVQDGVNRIALSPGGDWAVLWHDSDVGVPDEAIASFDEVSLVHLPTATHLPMVVGFIPHSVAFSAGGRRLVLVADAWAASLILGETEPSLIQLSDDLLEAPRAAEVVVSPDGSTAFIRYRDAAELGIVDLVGGSIAHLDLPSVPTDIDLTPDHRRLVAVARAAGEVWTIDVDHPLLYDPEIVALPGEPVLGAVAMVPGQDRAMLYTTADAVAYYGWWDLASGDVELRPLAKPVLDLGIASDGGGALVLHAADDDPERTNPSFAGEYALTALDLGNLRGNRVRLTAEPTGYALGENRAFFMLNREPVLGVVDRATLLVTDVPLPSEARYLGVLEGDVAWISQPHEYGRMTFCYPDGTTRTLTGFELASGIE